MLFFLASNRYSSRLTDREVINGHLFRADDTMKGLSDLFGFELGVVRSFLFCMEVEVVEGKQNLIIIQLCSSIGKGLVHKRQ